MNINEHFNYLIFFDFAKLFQFYAGFLMFAAFEQTSGGKSRGFF